MEVKDIGYVAIMLLIGGITLGVGASFLGSLYDIQVNAFTYSFTNESYSLVNGTNFTVLLPGNGLASVTLYNGDRTVTYTEGLNYTVNYQTGNIGLFNILA